MSEKKILEMIDKAKNSVNGMTEDQIEIYHSMLDNEAKELERISESTTSSNIDRVATVFIPAIKKLARDSFIDKLVGVQPIKDRIGLLQYEDYLFSKTDAVSGVTQGESLSDKPNTTEYTRDPGEGQDITRGIDFVFREKEIRAKQRKISGRWTFEAHDSATNAGYNVERQITKTMSSKIVEELNYEILMDLYNQASGGTISWTAPQATDTPTVKDRKEKELFYTIVDVASEIYNKTGRYPNWIVCNSKVASILRRTGDFVGTGATGAPVSSIKRLFRDGVLNDEFQVIVIPQLSTNDILLGYKGSSEVEAGAIYAPYIPLVVMDSFFNVDNWTWVKSVGSFYGKSVVLPELYGKVSVTF